MSNSGRKSNRMWLLASVATNTPHIVVSLIIFGGWLTGAYDYATDDGYRADSIMLFLLKWIIIPSAILAGLWMWLAVRGLKHNKRLWVYASILYGVICSAFSMSSVFMGVL